jgi:ketosteroid isomerase-like protein
MKTFLVMLLLPTAIFSQHSNDLSAIRQVMQRQQEAWNGVNLESFMQGYWKSDSLKFIGRHGITYGWQTTLDNYRKNYPTPEAMGTLTFTIVSLEMLGNDSAFMIGRYHLKRTADEPSGFFTLLWRKINDQWVIVSDHTS